MPRDFYVLIVCTLIHYFQLNYDFNTSKRYSLIIGITSAPGHFKERSLIRSTWIKPLAALNSVKYYFLIGKFPCLVPPEDRLFIESCSDWTSSFHDFESDWSKTFVAGLANNNLSNDVTSNVDKISEFIFTAAYDIKLTSVGIVSAVMKNNAEHVFIKIYDEKNTALLTVEVNNASLSSEDEKNVTWISIDPLILAKRFEGRVRVESENNVLFMDSTVCLQAQRHSTASVLHILHPTAKNACLIVGFKYSIYNIQSFKSFMDSKPVRLKNWLDEVNLLSQNLEEESAQFKDILALDVMDVYRNLPSKVLSFFQWIEQNEDFEYVLKTDDDSVIDVKSVMKELEDSLKFKKVWEWWSCFRKSWPVMDIGKWREYKFVSPFYPEFPSGAGYILKNTLVKYLVNNFNLLYKRFQGEDVSIGIWLSPLQPIKHFGKFCNWACDNVYYKFSCNVANVHPSHFNRYWTLFNSSA